MKGKIQLIKGTAEGEQLSVEAEFDTTDKHLTGDSLREEMAPFFDMIDGRLKEMNMRVIASNRLAKNMPVEAQMALHQAIDYLYGRAPKQDVVREYEKAVKEAQENEDKAGKGGHKGPVGTA